MTLGSPTSGDVHWGPGSSQPYVPPRRTFGGSRAERTAPYAHPMAIGHWEHPDMGSAGTLSPSPGDHRALHPIAPRRMGARHCSWGVWGCWGVRCGAPGAAPGSGSVPIQTGAVLQTRSEWLPKNLSQHNGGTGGDPAGGWGCWLGLVGPMVGCHHRDGKAWGLQGGAVHPNAVTTAPGRKRLARR